jgi:hypothetical protein
MPAVTGPRTTPSPRSRDHRSNFRTQVRTVS